MSKQEQKQLLHKENYYCIIGGIILIVLGYILMRGGRQDGPVFNADEIYSATRITVAPILILLGFGLEVFAIFYRPKQSK